MRGVTRRLSIAGRALAVAMLTLAMALPSIPIDVQAAAIRPPMAYGDQGLQGGWAIDDGGNVHFVHSLSAQAPLMREAGAGWVRINFRLGACFPDWVTAGCNGRTALQVYDEVVAIARGHGLKILGLLSNESWPGAPVDWRANNQERANGLGDNAYVQQFAETAGVLAAHFAGRIWQWEVWNEPNVGDTFMFPSNFAWLLSRTYPAIKRADPAALVVSGGLASVDWSGAAECAGSLPSGANYLCATYVAGRALAGWQAGAYPLDAVGQHLYISDAGTPNDNYVAGYLLDVRNAYVKFEGMRTAKKIMVTEVGWGTDLVSTPVQAGSLQLTFATLRRTEYVARGFWFSIQDIPEAVPGLYFGLVDAAGVRKPAFAVFQRYAAY